MRLSGWHLPVEHLSASSLSQFITCAEQFRQERLLGIPKRVFLDAFIGIVHHETIGENFSQKVESGRDQTIEQAKSVYHYKWAEQIEQKGEPTWTDHPERVEELGIKMLTGFHLNVAPTIKPISVEQRFEERVPGLPVPVVGYVDLEEKDTIQELKTAKQAVKKPKPNWRFQARVYQLFVPKPVYWTVTTKQKTPVNWTWETAPDLVLPLASPDSTVRMMQQAAETMNDYYLRYGPDRPWPTSGLMHPFACDFCSAGPRNPTPTCPAWSTS